MSETDDAAAAAAAIVRRLAAFDVLGTDVAVQRVAAGSGVGPEAFLTSRQCIAAVSSRQRRRHAGPSGLP